ncbi:MAG: response regulator [Gammaproteobacteria bacterium]
MISDHLKILFIDDSRLVRAAVKKILSSGCHLIEAEDGLAGWSVLNTNNQIDLVITDLTMPNLDGLGLLNKIRRSDNPHLQKIPVIIATGAEDGDGDGSRETALAAGANLFITKPYNAKNLTSSIQSVMQEFSPESKTLQPDICNQEQLLAIGEEQLLNAIRQHKELAFMKLAIDKYKILYLRKGKAFVESLSRELLARLVTIKQPEHTLAQTDIAEYCLLMPNTDPITAKHTAGIIKHKLEASTYRIDDCEHAITVNIGLSCPVIRTGVQLKQLLDDASIKLTPSSNTSQPDNAQTARTKNIARRRSNDSSRLFTLLDQLTDQIRRQENIDPGLLMQKILPLLHDWNQKMGGICTDEINKLEAVSRSPTADTKTQHKITTEEPA